MSGWVSLYRELLIKPIWTKSNAKQKTILITLLLMANHEPNEWEWQGVKFKVNSGQFITSLENIAKKAGSDISIRNVRTAIERFRNLDFLTNESTKTGRLISIVNWQSYQSTEKQRQSKRQRPDKDLTTNNNDNNEIKITEEFFENKDFIPLVVEWLDYKKQRKEKKYTDTGLKAFCKKLLKLSDSDPLKAKEIIEQSFAFNYAGIFELRNGTNNQNKGGTDNDEYSPV